MREPRPIETDIVFSLAPSFLSFLWPLSTLPKRRTFYVTIPVLYMSGPFYLQAIALKNSSKTIQRRPHLAHLTFGIHDDVSKNQARELTISLGFSSGLSLFFRGHSPITELLLYRSDRGRAYPHTRDTSIAISNETIGQAVRTSVLGRQRKKKRKKRSPTDRFFLFIFLFHWPILFLVSVEKN